MGRNVNCAAALAALCVFHSGCATPPDARYVYQDGEFGVIGIPRNSMLGKKDYREQAQHLMLMHFPEGFEIVRAEEVVEGERIFEAARKFEVDSEPGVSALNQMLKIGKLAKSTAIDQKDTVHITESRIIYRRKPDGKSTGHDGFAALATASPELYLDPNKKLREMSIEETLLAKKEANGAKSNAKDKDASKETKVADGKLRDLKDGEVQKASHVDPK